MLLLQGGRGAIGLGQMGVKGAMCLTMSKISNSPYKVGDIIESKDADIEDILFGFASDKSGSFRALASVATQIADEMDGLDVDVVECGISPAKDRVVAEVRREMMELGYHYDDLTDEVIEDMLSEFDFDGDEEKLIAEIVKEADEFVKAARELGNEEFTKASAIAELRETLAECFNRICKLEATR